MAQDQSDLDTRMVGFRDKIADGMFNSESGELRPGFRVTAEDVVIDVGCGGGMDSMFCAGQGAHVIYVDSNPNEVAVLGTRLAGTKARKLTPIVSDANPLPVPDGTATRVIASEVLEHVDDPRQFLQELIRVGAPNALFMLAVPDPASEKLQVGLAAPVYFQKPNHVRIFERDAFTSLVADSGLTIESQGCNSFYWSIWWMLFWICNVDLSQSHPMLESWSRTWSMLLDMPGSDPVRRGLNQLLPKSQYVVARKVKPLGMLGAIRKILTGARGSVLPAKASGDVPPQSLPLTGEPGPALAAYDAAKDGWFAFDKTEIFPGFKIQADDTVLDAGCGRGDCSVACAELGADLTAVDHDGENIAATTRRVAQTGIRSFTPIVGDTRTLPDAHFTKIVAMDAIGVDSDPAAALRDLARVGKPGALYLLGVQDTLQHRLLRQLAPSNHAPQATFSRPAFEQAVAAAGLVVERIESQGFYQALWFVLSSVCNGADHPLLTQWDHTWKLVLESPDGHKVKQRLDNFLPRTHLVVARKP